MSFALHISLSYNTSFLRTFSLHIRISIILTWSLNTFLFSFLLLFFHWPVSIAKVSSQSLFSFSLLVPLIRIEDGKFYLFLFYLLILNLGLGLAWCHIWLSQSHSHISQKNIEESGTIMLYHILMVCSIYIL